MVHRQIPRRVRIRLRPQPLEKQGQLRPRRLVRGSSPTPTPTASATSIRPGRTHLDPPRDIELRQIPHELMGKHRISTMRDERLARVLVDIPMARPKRARTRPSEVRVRLDGVDEVLPRARAVREEVNERRVEDANAAFA